MSIKHFFRTTPSLRISLRYCSIAIILLCIVAFILPTLLNYGPESINTQFDIDMSYISYVQQFILISFVVLLTLSLVTKFLLRDIDKWYKLDDDKKYKDINLIKKIRKKCFNLPYIIFAFEILIPIIGTVIFLFLTGSHHRIMVVKILVLILSFLLLLAVSSFIFAKSIYSEILAKTYSKDANIGFRVSIGKKIFMQVLPICICCLLITSLVGYSRSVKEKEDIFFNLYKKQLEETFSKSSSYDYESILELLNAITLQSDYHSKFIITPEDELITVFGPPVSTFVKEYTIRIAQSHAGRTYDSYGVDSQGSTLAIETSSGTFYVGILFDIASESSLAFFIINFLALLCLISIVLYLFGKSLSNDLTMITQGFTNIYNQNSSGVELPVTSNDEIGDLIISFNKIQKLYQDQLKQIEDNQDKLMEKERLASLGQLIGGIAHNLKTPIMSIAGAAEGLNDLIKEYDASIGDAEVTNQDHHEIAKDMSTWIEKIKSYTEYMSDVITAVKGQAVTLSDEQAYTFSIEELVKRIDILMKHELKNALVNLVMDLQIEPDVTLKGNVNSLVQVINNMISNSIQAYNGQKNQNIDLIIVQENTNIIITIRDYAGGLPEEVEKKLFKEMITTKGKNGTGLGLFMSYSNIRAHFNGNITFETQKGIGTSFHIILPL
ncbi:MAG: ATP-binding protein [Clostridia bacterium]